MGETSNRTKPIKSRQGSYVLETAVILPLIVLCILSLGYFTRVLGVWENCFYCALDETGKAQAMAWDGASIYGAKLRIENRLEKSELRPSAFEVRTFIPEMTLGGRDRVSSYNLSAKVEMKLPVGFSRDFDFNAPIVYRGFLGRNMTGEPLGVSGLENGVPGDPAYIFPAYGKKYHKETCTYVKASVHAERLNSSLRSRYDPCKACHSGDIPDGSIVFCFSSSGSSYHKASCRTIDRHVIVMDKGEAADKGYTPCSKCGN